MDVVDELLTNIRNTPLIEYIAVIFGIVSVILSRMENIWVYPTGLVNTIIYVYLCYFSWELYAEASVNIFYTIMSIYGWIVWARKKPGTNAVIHVSWNTKKEWMISGAFFLVVWTILFYVLKVHSDSSVPLADSFAGASAYTGMLLMARKKVESWIWWIITNTASIPLYFYKGAVFTSFQYVVFLVLAVMGFITWRKKVLEMKAIPPA